MPNLLLDEVMPSLTDTEWRLLCVVLRQTFGRRDRLRDWLSHNQLKIRTGRASAALSRALDSLVKRGLVEVSDQSGRLLNSPKERRRATTRLYYRISPQVLRPATSPPVISQSENRKAKTTKQTRTESIPPERGLASGTPREQPTKAAPEALRSSSPPALNQAVPASEVFALLSLYIRLFRQHSPRGEAPLLSWRRDSGICREMLAHYGRERSEQLLRRFFQSPESRIQRSGYSLPTFQAAIGQLPYVARAEYPARTPNQRGTTA